MTHVLIGAAAALCLAALAAPAAAQEGPRPPAGDGGGAPAEGRFGPQALYGGAGFRLFDPEGADSERFAELGVGAEFELWRFAVGLDLRIALDDKGEVRGRDWDEVSDWPNIVDYAAYGRQSDDIYVRLGTLRDQTLGHGSILAHYRSDTDYDSRTVGAHARWRGESFEIEALTSDITGYSLAGGRFAFEPFALAGSDLPLLKDLRLGAAYVADTDAPARLVPADGEALNGIDDDGDGTIDELSIDGRDNVRFRSAPLHVAAIEVELPLVETSLFRLVPYADAVHIFDFGNGLHAGAAMTFELPLLMRPALGGRGEYRVLGKEYIPGYFDTFYDVERVRYPDRSSRATKREALEGVRSRDGWYAEAWAELPRFARAGGSLEDYGEDESDRLVLWAEVDGLEWVRARGQYVKRGVRGGDDLFTLDDRSFLSALLLLRLYDPVWLELRFTRAWTLDERTGEYVPVDAFGAGLTIAYRF